MNKPVSILARAQSFKYAFRGIAFMLSSQFTARIHAVATVLVCAAGFYFRLARAEWCWMVVAIMAVWAAEALNTAIEVLGDAVSSEYHPLVGKAKDLAAGAVLICAIGAAVIGVLVLGPHLLEQFPSLGKF